LIHLLSTAYGALAASRRARYGATPSLRRKLGRPVISVGNLRVGGSGKTPVVAYLARLLLEWGEQPVVLTRGYARKIPRDGVTVVSDRSSVLADLSTAGDEPLMLARALAGVPVLVSADRYLSGVLSERRFDATVHLLDDGFQHLELERDVDLLLLSEEDLTDRPLPGGRLRERVEAARHADAALVTAGYDTAAARVGRAAGVPTVFRLARTIGAPRQVAAPRDPVVVPAASRVFVLTGIARPDRFIADVAAAGWEIAGTMNFRDHYPFTARDVARIATAARAAGSAIVLTTEKDAVRLADLPLGDLPIAALPLVVGIEPELPFCEWLRARLHEASEAHRCER
jgi:tetraacyldisaccharide 4'-kinase